MTFLCKLSFTFFLLIAVIVRVSGQPLVSPLGVVTQNQVFLSVGLEPELVTIVGYNHLVSQSGERFNFHLGTKLKFAPLILKNRAFRLNIVGIMDIEMDQQWKTRFSPAIYWVHDNNRAAVMNGLGVDLRSSTLHFGDKWTKGFELEWQYKGLANSKHSSESKDTFAERYPNDITGINGPIDGWYKATSSRFRIGFLSSISVGKQLDLQIGFGTHLAIQKQGIQLGFSYAQVPIYLKSTLVYQY